MIADVTSEKLTVERAEDLMDTYRWLRRMTYHLWRIRSWLEYAGEQVGERKEGLLQPVSGIGSD